MKTSSNKMSGGLFYSVLHLDNHSKQSIENDWWASWGVWQCNNSGIMKHQEYGSFSLDLIKFIDLNLISS